MITCPVCKNLLDSMGHPQVKCPFCGTIIDSAVNQGIPPAPAGSSPGGPSHGYEPAPSQGHGSPQPPVQSQQAQQPGPQHYSQPPPQPDSQYHQPQQGSYQPQPMPQQPIPGYQQPYPPMYGPPGPQPMYREDYYPVETNDAINGAFEIYKKNFWEFFGFYTVPAIIMILLFAMMNLFEAGTMSLAGFLIFLPIVLIGSIVSMLFAGGLIAMTREAMEKGVTSSKTGYDTIQSKAGPIISASIVVSLLVVLGTFMCIIPGLIFCYWYYFTVTIVVLEGYRTGDALKRSKEFSESHNALGFIITLTLILVAISIVSSIINSLIALAVDDPILNAIITGMVSWVIGPYGTIAAAYYYIKGRRLDQQPAMQQGYQGPPGYQHVPQSPQEYPVYQGPGGQEGGYLPDDIGNSPPSDREGHPAHGPEEGYDPNSPDEPEY